jgi:hypothetical protein
LPKPDEGVFYDNGRVMNRWRWTLEERDAVKAKQFTVVKIGIRAAEVLVKVRVHASDSILN